MPDTSQPITVARFYVQSVEDQRDASSVKLNAVSRGNHNASWSHFTPAGNLQMTVNNPAVIEAFRAVLADKTKPPEVEIVISPVVVFHTPEDGHAFVPPPELPDSSWYYGRCLECAHPEEAHVQR